MSLPLILETRQAVLGAIEKQEESNVVLDLMLAVFDTLLAENEVIYDLSASLDALLKAKDDYTGIRGSGDLGSGDGSLIRS